MVGDARDTPLSAILAADIGEAFVPSAAYFGDVNATGVYKTSLEKVRQRAPLNTAAQKHLSVLHHHLGARFGLPFSKKPHTAQRLDRAESRQQIQEISRGTFAPKIGRAGERPYRRGRDLSSKRSRHRARRGCLIAKPRRLPLNKRPLAVKVDLLELLELLHNQAKRPPISAVHARFRLQRAVARMEHLALR